MKRKASLKKSPLKRKKPKPRKTRTAIKRKGKQALYYEARNEDRQAWNREQTRRCMICQEPETWTLSYGLQVHEIERRSHTHTAYERTNYLLVCEPCHSGPLATMPHAKQLAYKLLRDPDNYDLIAWLKLRDPTLKAPERVTQSEVIQWLERLSTATNPAAYPSSKPARSPT